MADIERLTTLRDTLSRRTTPTGPSRSISSAVWRLRGWRSAEGKPPDAIAQLRAAADAEDATDKSAVSPGPLAPARELLGYMLLDAGRANEALIAFEAYRRQGAESFRGLYGAGHAAELPAIAAKPRASTSSY